MKRKEKNPLQCLVWFKLNGLGSSQNAQNNFIHNWCINGCWVTTTQLNEAIIYLPCITCFMELALNSSRLLVPLQNNSNLRLSSCIKHELMLLFVMNMTNNSSSKPYKILFINTLLIQKMHKGIRIKGEGEFKGSQVSTNQMSKTFHLNNRSFVIG